MRLLCLLLGLYCTARGVTSAFTVARRGKSLTIGSGNSLAQHSSSCASSPCCRLALSSAIRRLDTMTLGMGLYDTPLPPRKGEGNKNEEISLPESTRLFDMQSDGTEAREFLPPLGRSLDDATSSSRFNSSNTQVNMMVEKTKCRSEDAAWALEACQGDSVKAWECISKAQRTLLNELLEEKKQQELEEKEDWDCDLFSNLNQKEKDAPEDEDSPAPDNKRPRFADYYSKPDEKWLPGKPNPRPVDDEPWFTG